MNEQETHAEVIAEMRGAKTEFPFVYLMGEPDTPEIVDVKTKKIIEPRKINIRYVTVKELANRLEAAHERERGDCAKLREALAGLLDGICFHCDMSGDCKGVPCEKMQKARKALAKPPRNCDVGTAEEQSRRCFAYCKQYICKDCPCNTIARCSLLWAQKPYEEGGAM